MNLIGGGAVLACGDCAPPHPVAESNPYTVILLIAALVVISCVLFVWQRKRRSRHPGVTDQWGALGAMGDLCPDGWQAEIAIHGSQAPPQDAVSRSPVVLEWKLYEDHGDDVAVRRRVRAETIGEALQLMVDDRRLDIVLEQIERSAERDR